MNAQSPEHKYDTRTKRAPSVELVRVSKRTNRNQSNNGSTGHEHPGPLQDRSQRVHVPGPEQPESSGTISWFWSLLVGGKTPPEQKVLEAQEQFQVEWATWKSNHEALQRVYNDLTTNYNELLREREENKKQLADQQEMMLQNQEACVREIDGREVEQTRLIMSWSEQVDRAHREKSSAKSEANAAQKKLQAAERRCQNFERQKAALQNDLRKKAESSKKYEGEIAALQNTVQSLQMVRLQSMESARWAPLAISTIEHKLTAIMSDVRKWSQKYATLGIEKLLEVDTFRTISQLLVDRGCILTPGNLHIRLAGSKTMHNQNKAAALLLAAIVSSDILRKIIADPFFAFVGTPLEGLLQASQGKAMRDLIAMISEVDQDGGEALRYQLLRLLEPASSCRDSTRIEWIKQLVTGSRERSAQLIVQSMDEQFLQRMDLDRVQQAHSDLQKIVQEAAELSWSVWHRKQRIEVFDWNGLMQKFQTDVAYGHESASLELHPLNNKDVDEDPNALDCCTPVVLCSPLVVARGNADGKDWNQVVPIKKAVVWMGSE